MKLLLAEVLLPALCLVPANPGLVNDIWGVLHFVDYTDRWRIYNRLKVGVPATCGSTVCCLFKKLLIVPCARL